MKNEAKLKILEKCEKLVDVLIPGDPSLGLISASQSVRVRMAEDAELESLATMFIFEIEDILGHEIGAEEVMVAQLDQCLKSSSDSIRLFLMKILEIYYTDERVLSYYPNFSGNIFPNYRRLPSINIEMLEQVVSDHDD